jgi:hypothetical protein
MVDKTQNLVHISMYLQLYISVKLPLSSWPFVQEPSCDGFHELSKSKKALIAHYLLELR